MLENKTKHKSIVKMRHSYLQFKKTIEEIAYNYKVVSLSHSKSYDGYTPEYIITAIVEVENDKI